MNEVWIVIAAVAIVNVAIKGVGPALIGGRKLPPPCVRVIALLPAAVLAALVVSDTIGGLQRVEVDAKTLGLAAAGVALALRASPLVAMGAAVAATATARAIG